MRRWTPALPLAVLVTACAAAPSAHTATSPTTSASPVAMVSAVATPSASGPATAAPETPSPSPAGPPALGVLVDLLTNPTTYTISLVSSDGSVVKQVQAAQRTPITLQSGHAVTLPYVSTTLTSLYYLDGDSTVRILHLDGSAGPAARLDVPSGTEAAFAVSPDDRQIAVSVLDFTRSPVHLTLYTDALGGGSKKVIFESDSDYVWPVAWHAGMLVLAHPYGPLEEDIAKAAPGRDNPYSGVSYHVVNPANANRVVLMGACTVSGPLSPAGSGCIQGGSIDWQGNTAPWSTQDWGQVSSAASLSPNGDWMAATRPDAQTEMAIWRRDGTVANYVDGAGVLDWAGWLDDQTIVVASYRNASWQPEVVNMVQGGVVHVVQAHGFFAASLPTNIV
ncbi:MAG TPA: hypothetical protein VEU76_04530 [Candidatus Udaeobacter sp.]|nr:hypothetical protein [Candidatus Udaeobacter sp.]